MKATVYLYLYNTVVQNLCQSIWDQWLEWSQTFWIPSCCSFLMCLFVASHLVMLGLQPVLHSGIILAELMATIWDVRDLVLVQPRKKLARKAFYPLFIAQVPELPFLLTWWHCFSVTEMSLLCTLHYLNCNHVNKYLLESLRSIVNLPDIKTTLNFIKDRDGFFIVILYILLGYEFLDQTHWWSEAINSSVFRNHPGCALDLYYMESN